MAGKGSNCGGQGLSLPILAARYDSEEEVSNEKDNATELKEVLGGYSEDDSGISEEEGILRFLDEGPKRIGPKHIQPLRNALQKLDAKVKTGFVSYKANEEIEGVQVDARVDGTLRETDKKLTKNRVRITDKRDRATVDSVLDRRTRIILLKLLHRGVFSEIYGVVSTGKEANVYHAVDEKGNDLAIKIYKTSILGFRDRDRYVSGDYRFRKGYSRSNPRKMVTTWAEKEMRNLNRLQNSGIRSPKPIEQKLHVLVMEFIGMESKAAMRLKDVDLNEEQYLKAHRDLCMILWKLYSQCKLVHGDFSEYNILYSEGECYVIDVSQSVDLDHPLVLDFLREDCSHLIDFFRKQGVPTLTLRELFDFVTDPTVVSENVDRTLDKLLDIAKGRFDESGGKDDESEVFKKVFIPRKLEEVAEFERDIENVKKGVKEGVYYQTIMGLTEDLSGVQLVPKVIEQDLDDESASQDTDESEVTSSDEGEDEVERKRERNQPMSKAEIKAHRKENKKTVKEARREKRKTKMPKHVKKQLLKKGKQKR